MDTIEPLPEQPVLEFPPTEDEKFFIKFIRILKQFFKKSLKKIKISTNIK